MTDLLASLRLGGSEPPSVPPVPVAPGREEPQKSAMSRLSQPSRKDLPIRHSKFPLTAYMIDLMAAPDLRAIDPEAAALQYGLRPDVCREYLQRERNQRWAK